MTKKSCFLILFFFAFTSVSHGLEKEEVLAFADHLEKCTPYKGEFTHPFNGQKMQREIVGIIDGKCLYTEEMPNNGKMTCKHHIEQLPVIAQHYRDIITAKSSTVSAKIKFHGEEQEVKTTYTINGKEVKSPMQECLNNGTCVISGY